MKEDQYTDKKSIRALDKGKAGYKELAKDCVCFANSRGGRLLIGIEDNDELPPAGQVIHVDKLHEFQKRILNQVVNVSIIPALKTATNGGQYLEIIIQPSISSVAATIDGRYYLRSGEECRPVLPDDLLRLMTDKSAFVWELQVYLRVSFSDHDPEKLRWFKERLFQSRRASDFVVQMSDPELLEHYDLTKGDTLTNLGVLWLGRHYHRAKLLYSPTVQFIKYDNLDRKVNKTVWADHTLNPGQLIDDIWRRIPEWKDGVEIIDSMFPVFVPDYDEVVIRELLANAFAHRPYTIMGDVFIKLFSDRLEISNPGRFPLGITPANILHKSAQRNRALSQVLYDLNYMEKEGSGYDRMYEVLLSQGKTIPEPKDSEDGVMVTIRKRIVAKEVVAFMKRVGQSFQLKSKELICLGLIAQLGTVTMIELAERLNLPNSDSARKWMGSLLDYELVSSTGKTKGTTYKVTNETLRKMDFGGKTTLKRIESHRLRQLICEDLNIYGESSISEIHLRIGPEIPRRTVKNQLDVLIAHHEIYKKGVKRYTTYFLSTEK